MLFLKYLLTSYLFKMNIYVANVSFRAREQDLKELFQRFGEVSTVKIVTDRETGRSRGFGFVEMPNDAEAKQAIAQLNGVDFNERKLVVNEARPPKG
jgi:RNA recognition motif-containing protein